MAFYFDCPDISMGFFYFQQDLFASGPEDFLAPSHDGSQYFLHKVVFDVALVVGHI